MMLQAYIINGTFLAMIEKLSKRRLKKEIFKFVKSIVLAKNWFVVSKFLKVS